MNPVEWLARTYGVHADEWERILTITWLFLTPPVLTLTSVVLLVRLVIDGSWRRRMPRASFALVSSYTLIMWRFVFLRATGLETVPQPWALLLWTYAFLSTSYFAWAVLVEQFIPFLFRVAFWIGAHVCGYAWVKRICTSRFCEWLYNYHQHHYVMKKRGK